MPFKSKSQRRYLEMITHKPDFSGKTKKEVDSIKNFVDESEKLPQPKVEKVKPKFSKIMKKLGKK